MQKDKPQWPGYVGHLSRIPTSQVLVQNELKLNSLDSLAAKF